jgi:hypothetical protein
MPVSGELVFLSGELGNIVFSLSVVSCLMSVDKNTMFSSSCSTYLFFQLSKHNEQTIVAQPELFVELDTSKMTNILIDNNVFLTTDIKHVTQLNENTMFLIGELEKTWCCH